MTPSTTSMRRMIRLASVIGVLASLSGCARHPLTLGARREAQWRATTAILSGMIRDSATGLPLAGVSVAIRGAQMPLYEQTDSAGRFRVEYVKPEPTSVEISRRGYLSRTAAVRLTARENESINIALVRAAPPCCRLTGGWELFLVLDSAALGEKRALVRQLSAGTLTFADSASLLADRLRDETSLVRHELGVSALDLSPMLGEGYRPGEFTRMLVSMGGEVDGSMERVVLATTFSGDSVEVDSPPAIDHYGIILDGRISGDSITGRWFQKKFCCGASGHFVLRRRG